MLFWWKRWKPSAAWRCIKAEITNGTFQNFACPSVRPSVLLVVHRFVNLFARRFAHLGRYRYLYRKLNILYIWERNSLQRCVHFVVVAFGNITIYITLCPKATCRSEGKPSCSQECRTNCMRQSGKLLTSRFTS